MIHLYSIITASFLYSSPFFLFMIIKSTSNLNKLPIVAMEWLDNLFDIPHIGASDGCYAAQNNWNADSKPSNREDLDRAISLSLLEDDRRKGHDVDEELAKALRESMNLHSRSPNTRFLPVQQRTHSQRVCRGCSKSIDTGNYLQCFGGFWHVRCFRCYSCGAPIIEEEYLAVANRPYHKGCYKLQFHPKCDVCRDFIPVNQAGMIEYRVHPFWKLKFCLKHDFDNTPRCSSCERIQAKDMLYISLGDGRRLCLECLHTAVMDTSECQQLYHEIRDFFEGLNMKISQQVPMLLVERHALNEAIQCEKNVPPHKIPETRGLCLAEEQTVWTIFSKPRICGNQITDVRTYPRKLIRHCEVTAILVLFGLPRLLTGLILTHELMHAWFRLNGFEDIRLDVEEGICQVLAHMWLESEVMSGSGSDSGSSASSKSKAPRTAMEKRLGEFFLYQIVKDTSRIYGDGFRTAHASVMKFGLKSTLNHVKMTGQFPL